MKVPMGWSRGSLGDVISTVRGGYSVKCDDRQAMPDEMAVLKTGAVLNGRLDISQNKYVPPSEHTSLRTPVKAGTIIICRKNSEETIGSSALALTDAPNVFLSDLLWELHPVPSVDRDWLATSLKSDRLRKLIQIAATGTQSTMKNISQDRLLNIPVEIPPLPEQRKIAEILRTWDEAIEKLEALRAAKEHQLEGFTARLIHGAQAAHQHLREHTSEVSERNRGQCVDRILSVTNSAGFVLAEDQFAHRVASVDTSNYKIVRQGQYAYNPSRINVGSIARLDDWPEGALSPMYVVFELRDTLDTDFFSHWLRSGEARKRIALAAQGSVRDTVSFGDLGSIQLPLPPIEEQRRIARALSATKEELSLLDKEVETLTRQKRGLMQKLLTGEWRVELEEPVA